MSLFLLWAGVFGWFLGGLFAYAKANDEKRALVVEGVANVFIFSIAVTAGALIMRLLT
jgi:hypothetical protein